MLVTYCFFLSYGVAMKGIQFTQLRCHISFLSFIWLTTCFLSSRGQLLDSRKHRLFHLYIQHATHCHSEQQISVGSSETAVCGFWVSISQCGTITLKAILIFPKNFLDFGLDTIKKQCIINLSSYSSKSYAFVVLGDSEVTFLEEGMDAIFHPFLNWVLCIDCIWRSMSNFLVFQTSGGISLRLTALLLFFFKYCIKS